MKPLMKIGAVATVALLALTGCSGNGSSGDSGKKVDHLSVLIGSSGAAETQSVKDAAKAYGDKEGITIDVIPASDLNQELAQGFAGGSEPDAFYMSWDQFQTYAANGYLDAYGDSLGNKDAFYPNLKDAFTYNGKFTCAPKDFSTLGLVINNGLWQQAGLTDADIPKTWEDLSKVSAKLTSGDVAGLSMGAEYARVGVFMKQAGGGVIDGDKITANSDANVKGLEYVQSLLKAGSLKWPSDLGAGWGGEAFGKGKAAMVVEGPWISGALKKDYPNIDYRVVELPAGPSGKGTFTFSNCWGLPEGKDSNDTAKKFVEFLTSDEQQEKFADEIGVIPSTKDAAKKYASDNAKNTPFVAAADYAVSPVAFKGSSDVIKEFNTGITGLASADIKALLDKLQAQLEQAQKSNTK